jgi:hypothetical protein
MLLTRKATLFFFMVLCANAQAQAVGGFRKLSGPEKWWVLAHPFIAKRTFRLTQQVLRVCDSLKSDTLLDGDPNGGQLDAFRHSYWMCVLAQHIPAKKAYRLGLAHERGNYLDFRRHTSEDNALPDSISGLMDLLNNQVGLQVGTRNKRSAIPLSDAALIGEIIGQVHKGSMLVCLKNKKGRFLTCEGEVINMETYRGKWGVPKCLVRSDAVRW